MRQPGDVLGGKYRVVRVVGRGGMGAVYEAEALHLGKIWAVKELTPPFDDEDEVQRYAVQFQAEARLLANLDHYGLPRVVDFFQDGRGHFLVMDFIRGRDMEQVAREHGALLDEQTVLAWADEILDIVAYLHGLDPPVIVRDIKPSNIMLTQSGRIKLIDFGIARLASQGGRTGTVIRGAGSPGFAPIEQYGAAGTDVRSDIYALGATLYYLLTGVIPLDSLTVVMNGSAQVPIAQFNPRVSERTQQVVMHMMAPQPGGRPASVEEVRAALGLSGSGARPLPVPAPLGAAPAAAPAPPAGGLPTQYGVAAAASTPARETVSRTHPTDGSELVLVPRGAFVMGSAEGEGRDDESPTTELDLPAYYIGRYPVTRSQFARFVHETGYTARGQWTAEPGDHPVTGVTLYDAAAYCAWAGLRLPSEAEHEKAARGADGRRYPWGERWEPDRANGWLTERPSALQRRIDLVAGRGTVPVGCFPDGAAPCGAHDLAGNVQEWTGTVYASYPYHPSDGREAQDIEATWPFVIRGSHWGSAERLDFRTTARAWSYPAVWSPKLGFRVACDA